MAARVPRNPLDRRAREKEIEVVLDASSRDLGSVRVTVCEMPAGMIIDLREEGVALTSELSQLGEELAKEEERYAAKRAELRQAEAALEQREALRIEQKASLDAIRRRRNEVQRGILQMKLSVIRWGVAGHRSADFLDERDEAVPFLSEEDTFDEVRYRVASKVIVATYQGLGAAFIEALYLAATAWQSGRFRTPEQVWGEREKLMAMAEKLQEQKLLDPLPAPSMPETKGATTTPAPSPIPTNLVSQGT